MSIAKKITFLNGCIGAGFPTPASDYAASPIDINDLVIDNPTATYFAKVEGKSMVGAGILEGSYLVIDRSKNAVHNDIVVAVLNGEFMVKRLFIDAGQITLSPENDAYAPVIIHSGMDFHVWGIVTWVFTPATCMQ